MKIRYIAGFVVIGLLSACTQLPVGVDYRGSTYYGRERDDILNGKHQTYSEDSSRYKPAYTHSVEKAAVPTVGITELPAPGKTAVPASTANAPFHAPSKPLDSNVATKPAQAGMFIWPVEGGKVISRFSLKPGNKGNDGINIITGEGEPIWATAPGAVVYAGNELRGYGNMVILKHANGFMSAYAHMRSVSVKKGENVKQGALIGYVGVSGGVKSPQVHFALREGKQPVDPENYLPKR